MKRTLFVLALTTLTIFPAQAGSKIDDPAAFVKGVYAGWAKSQTVPDDIYTPRLTALIALDNKEAHGEVGRGNDFSVWCNCQDGELKKATVSSRDVENAVGRKVVDAKFELDGKRQEIFFYFEKTRDGWKLDDVRLIGKGGWTYSLLLKYGWDDAK